MARAGLSTAHWFACCAGLAVGATLTFSNLDGYHNHIFGQRHFDQEPPLINWAHGWPSCFLIRQSPWLSAPPANATLAADGTPIYSRWPFDSAPVLRFYPRLLLIDSAVAAIMLVGTFWMAQRLAVGLSLKLRFGLKSLFVLTAIVATTCAIGLPLPPVVKLRHVAHYAALMVLVSATGTTVIAALDITFIALKSWSRRRGRYIGGATRQ